MELRKHIGKRIKYFRNKNNMSQEVLAEMLETTKQTVSRYENGERQANQDVLFQLSNIFKVSINDFFPTFDYLRDMTSSYTYYPESISAGLPVNVDGMTNADKINIPDSIMGKHAGKNDIYITKISGDSMDKVMQDGSLIAVKPISIESLKDGDMVVFSNGHEYSVKYYYRQDDKLIFKPNSKNKEHHEQHYNADENITIHGKVVLYIVEID